MKSNPGRSNLMRKVLETSRDYYAGDAIHIQGFQLTLEPRHPQARIYRLIADFEGYSSSAKDKYEFIGENTFKCKYINSWWSRKLDRIVTIGFDRRRKEYFVSKGLQSWEIRLGLFKNSFLSATAHDLKSEETALQTLKGLISEAQYESYVTNGAFVVKGKNPKCIYIIKKGKPTIYMGYGMPIALCLHGLGYYEGTFTGALVPTDDAITHLLYIRRSEHLFWRKSNIHPLWHPTSGV